MVPRLLEKKGIDESRHGSRARPRHRRGFFLWFTFEPRNRRGISNFAQTRPRSRQVVFQKRTRYSIDFEEYTHPAQQPNPPKNARFVGFMEILGTYGQHVHPKSEVRGHPTPCPPQPPLPPPSSPPSTSSPTPLISHILRDYFPETVFLNVCGAQELPRNEFRQPM